MVLVLLRSSVAVVLIRGLSEAAVGWYYFLFLVATLLATPTKGAAGALRKRGSEATSDTSEHLAFSLSVVFGYAAVVLVAVSGVAAGFDLHGLAVQFTLPDAAAVAALVAGFGSISLTHALVDAWGYPGRSTWIRAGTELTFLAALAALVSAGVDRAAPLLGLYAGLFVSVLVGVLVVCRFPVSRPSFGTVLSSLRYTVWSGAAVFVGEVLVNHTTLTLAVVAGSAAAGQFKTASELTILGSYMAIGVVDPVFVRISRDDSLDRDVTETVRTGLTYAPIVGLGAAAVIVPLRHRLAPALLDSEAAVVAVVLAGLAVAKGIYPFRRVCSETLKALDRPDTVFRIRLVTAATAVPVTVALIHWYGLLGGLAGYLARAVFQLAAVAVAAGRVLDEPLVTPTLVAEFVAASAVAVALAPFAPRIPATTPAVLAAAVAGGALYAALLVALSAEIRGGIAATADDAGSLVERTVRRGTNGAWLVDRGLDDRS